MLNQAFLEDQEFFPFTAAANMISSHLPLDSNQTLKNLSPSHPLSQHSKPELDLGACHDLLSNLQTSNANYWAWGEVSEIISNKILGRSIMNRDDHLGVSGMKMKKFKSRRKVREPRFCFKTMSDVDVLDDGYKWRKYGQKVVKNTQHPRSYYRCTQDSCRVKKRVERLAEDPRMVITTYEGRHAHSPSQNEEDSEANSSKLCNFFWL
ncbi:hypothetical protein OSB04_006744 [Centaurea solstitialis]|uniref:WRKY domain-containing protein n=1 Tax=Centaurea solstitialis TaxID=347529 RepID=A0AA38TIJ2_9ASTR|nr:hypothetical protein OSB04_006744 [Centaurea solstitialis]